LNILAFAALPLLTLLSMTINIFFGAVEIEPAVILKIILNKHDDLLTMEIIKSIRIPRTIAATLTGGMLAVCGTVMQASVRNHLADPYLMGISAGASLGATAAILFGVTFFNFGVPLSAFLGSLLSSVLVLILASRDASSVLRILLAGIAINALCSSLSSLLMYLHDDAHAIREVVFWLMGSLTSADWGKLRFPAVAVVAGTIYFCAKYKKLNLIIIGDEDAYSLGVNPRKHRIIFIVVTALMTSSCVSYFGIVGFVGLITPHILRFLMGADHKHLVPYSFCLGAIILLWSDLLARTLANSEIPLGVITGIIGSPFFFWLLFRTSKT
jgi:iron complex transport system permease protein